MTPEQRLEVLRLVRMLQIRSIRHFATLKGVAGPKETPENTAKGKGKAQTDLETYLKGI